MDGLTNIITKIREQSAEECKAIVDAANETAEKIVSDAVVSAEKAALAIEQKTREKADIIDSKAKSSSLLEYKRVILSEKSKIIDEIVAQAVKSLENSDDVTYFGYIEKLVKANAAGGDGCIRFNERDLKRLPKDFEKKLNDICADKGKLSVSDVPFDCSGGFVIEYPEIKIDCTILSLVEDKIDEIRDEISKALFA